MQGCIIYLVLFTKQNIGCLYIISIIISEIYYYKKTSIMRLLKQGIFSCILLATTLVVMLCENNLHEFFNYTVLGMFEFTGNNISIQENLEFIIGYFGIIAIFSYILTLILFKVKVLKDNKIIILLIFAVTLNFSAYPIFNLYHTSFAILLNIIVLIYIFDKLLLKNKFSKKINLIIIIIIYIVINIFSISCGLRTHKNIKITDKKNIYYSANMSKQLNENLNEITKYILQQEKQNIDVICISSDAALYMTYLNKNNKEMDLIFEGNLGYKGKQKTMQKIRNLDNVEILMNKEIYWQELTELREYVIKNYRKKGTIGNCYIFEKYSKN